MLTLTTNLSLSDGTSQNRMVVAQFLITSSRRKTNLVVGLMPLSLMTKTVLPPLMSWKPVFLASVKESGTSSELLL